VTDASSLPSEEEVGLLARFAVAAFAARCARMAHARHTEFASWDWVTQAIESAISRAEQVAATGEFPSSAFSRGASRRWRGGPRSGTGARVLT